MAVIFFISSSRESYQLATAQLMRMTAEHVNNINYNNNETYSCKQAKTVGVIHGNLKQ
jgi:hypothetical protein